MKILARHLVAVLIGIAMLAADIIFLAEEKVFLFVAGIAVFVAIIPFVTSAITEVGREKQKEQQFLEFTRNLVEAVKTGTPISKGIIQIRNKDFGSLGPHVKKLANQIALGISVRESFQVFASDINNKVVSRSIALITEAEESGGEISLILESTAKSVSEIEDIKKERRSSTYNLVVQGYIIFMIFLVIMIVVQTQFLPLMIKTLQESGASGAGSQFTKTTIQTDILDKLGNLFIILIIVQGLFAGLVIGKLSEGSVKAGIKHSIIMVSFAYLLTFGVRIFV